MGLFDWFFGTPEDDEHTYIDDDERYRIISTLGSGGFAQAYLIEEEETGEFYAAKLGLYAPGLAEELGGGFDLEAELRLWLSVEHPNVADAHQEYFVQEEGGVYILSEFCEGPTLWELREALGDDRELAVMAEIGRQLARGLQAIHGEGLLHGDLSPANVIVSDGVVKIIDFGLASAAVAAVTRTAIGTPGFVAPELGFRRGTERSDLFSLGMILYYLWSGKTSMDEDDLGRPSALLELHFTKPKSSVEAELIDVIKKCTAIEPANRYKKAGAVARDLAHLARSCDRDWWPDILARLYGAGNNICQICEEMLPGFAVYCPACGDGPYAPDMLAKEVPTGILPYPCKECDERNSIGFEYCHACGDPLRGWDEEDEDEDDEDDEDEWE